MGAVYVCDGFVFSPPLLRSCVGIYYVRMHSFEKQKCWHHDTFLGFEAHPSTRTLQGDRASNNRTVLSGKLAANTTRHIVKAEHWPRHLLFKRNTTNRRLSGQRSHTCDRVFGRFASPPWGTTSVFFPSYARYVQKYESISTRPVLSVFASPTGG